MRIAVDKAGVEELARKDADELLVEIGHVLEAEKPQSALVVHFHALDPLRRQDPLPRPLPKYFWYFDEGKVLGERLGISIKMKLSMLIQLFR